MNESGTGADFRAKSNLTALITTALIYPAVLLFSAIGEKNIFELAAILAVGVVLQISIMIVIHIFLALKTTQEPDDERDHDLARRASHVSGTVMTSSVVIVLLIMLVRAMIATVSSGGETNVDLWPLYGIFGSLILSELVRYTITARGYRVD
ncbi:MAG: hypothetical protein P1U42_07065 [Phycisphaerales bacterium]|nr:hypothetical protein [Phycisphaerales bacterium]